jgi:hypothetical protein
MNTAINKSETLINRLESLNEIIQKYPKKSATLTILNKVNNLNDTLDHVLSLVDNLIDDINLNQDTYNQNNDELKEYLETEKIHNKINKQVMDHFFPQILLYRFQLQNEYENENKTK